MRLVDLTPVGLQTPEGIARVNAATNAVDEANREMAAACCWLLSELEHASMTPRVQGAFNRAQVTRHARGLAIEQLVLALAGAPKDEP